MKGTRFDMTIVQAEETHIVPKYRLNLRTFFTRGLPLFWSFLAGYTGVNTADIVGRAKPGAMMG